MPYNNDPRSPFVPPDFTVGLPPSQDWPHHAGEPPWILDPEDCPKPSCAVPAESTGPSSMDEGRRKKKKKKKHRRSKKSEKSELKVTTQGQGDDTPVWTHTGSPKDSSASSDSQTEGDSGLGSNPSNPPRRGTDTDSRWGLTLRSSPDTARPVIEAVEDTPLSDWGDGDGDQEMPDADEWPGDDDPVGSGAEPILIADEAPEPAQLGGDPADAGEGGEPQDPPRSFFWVSEPYPRPCQKPMGPLALTYRRSSGGP